MKRNNARGGSLKRNGRKNSSSNSNGSERTSTGSSSELMDFFIHELKDLYWAEKHLVKALPKMEKAATSGELKDALSEHLAVTEAQVSRLEKVFNILGEKPQAKKCDGMKGLTDEGESVKKNTEKNSFTRDVGLIISAQKVEHYEIAAYGSLVQIAKTLNINEVVPLLEKTLEEEKEADQKLTAIAESNINEEAVIEG